MLSVEPGPVRGLNDLVRNGIAAPELSAWLSEEPRRPYLVNIARKISELAGEDAFQDFLIVPLARVLHGWRNPLAIELREEDHFHRYFLRSFRRYVNRATKRIREVQGIDDLQPVDPGAQAALEDVVRDIDNETVGEVLKAARERLAKRDQDLIRWRIDEELSHAEIAARIHKTDNNVRVLVHRAIQKLRLSLCLYRAADVSNPEGIRILIRGFAKSPSPSPLERQLYEELNPFAPDVVAERRTNSQPENVRAKVASALNKLVTKPDLLGVAVAPATGNGSNHGLHHIVPNRVALDQVLDPHVRKLISL